jgi:non-specific serine/threonine protein kinase
MESPARTDESPLYRYRFGNTEFDEARHELRVGGLAVELEQRPLQVLACLLHRADEVVARQELFDTVWGARPTVDNVLANAVAKLRKALGKTEAARIQTLPRIGYRLAGPVERSVSGRRLGSRLALERGQPVPGRAHFVLEWQLGPAHGSEVWQARHGKTGELRVYKFSTDGEHLAALKREATLYRVLHDTLGERDDIVHVLDWNFDQPPFYLECEHGGSNLADWASEPPGLAALPLEQRLQLFLGIADAVAAAHGVGVLHKDLKPANVLVTPKGEGWQPRLADFGSGRLLDPESLEQLGITAMGLTVTQAVHGDSSGTLLYLAPELLSGAAPTVRSDVYALGLMLYQMSIADFRRQLAPGWEQDIDDELLREDIAAATDGNPARRLASVSGLTDRLRNRVTRRDEHQRLHDVEVRARNAERLLERSRARRPWITTAGVLLLAGLGISLWQFMRAHDALEQARRQTAIADAANRFLNDDLLGAGIGGDSPAWYERNPSLREILDAAALRLDQRFGGGPLLRAGLHQTLGRAYRSTGAYIKAEPQLRSALELLQRGAGAADDRSVLAQYELAGVLSHLSRFKEADALLDGADASAGARLGAVSEIALRSHLTRGDVLYQQFQVAPALAQYRNADNLQRLLRPDDARLSAHLLLAIAGCELRLGHPGKAERIARRILAGAPYTPERIGLAGIALARSRLGDALRGQKRYREAIAVTQRSVEDYERAGGPDSQGAITSLSTLGYLYSLTGDGARSLQIQREVYQRSLQRWGARNQYTLVELLNLGSAEQESGELDNALLHIRQAAAGLAAIGDKDNPTLQAARVAEATVLGSLGRNAEALKLIEEVDPKAYQATTSDPGRAAVLKAFKAQILLGMGERKRGESMLREALAEMQGDGVSEDEMAPFRKQLMGVVAVN